MRKELKFPKPLLDEDTHTYSVNGVIYPSVSEIISPLYDWSGIPKPHIEYAAERGKAVHKACELHDKGTLDFSSVDASIMPYLSAWLDFKIDFDVEIILNETPLFNGQFCGTPDRIATANIRGKTQTCVIDVKSTAQIHRPVGVQLKAYEMLAKANGEHEADHRFAVRLQPDGRYFYHEFQAQDDAAEFIALTTDYFWRRKNLRK